MKHTCLAAIVIMSTTCHGGSALAVADYVRRPALVEDYANAETVFSGVAMRCERVPCAGFTGGDCEQDRWEFAVGQIWKGPVIDRIQVYDMPASGIRFQVGGHYVVYARRMGRLDALYVPGNTLTKEASVALVERYSLGPATVVSDSLRLPDVSAEAAANCLLQQWRRNQALFGPVRCDTIDLFESVGE